MPKAKALQQKKQTLKRHHPYTQETLAEACLFLDENPGLLSYKDASVKYGIPHSTLYDRHHGTHTTVRDAHMKQQRLTPDQEAVLCDWLEHLVDQGRPLNKRDILNIVKLLCGVEPGGRWVSRFLERHPEIVLGKPSGLDPKRAQAFNRPVVMRYFALLCEIMAKYNIPWSHVWNMDEKGIQRGGGRKLQAIKYFVSRGRRPKYKLRSANLELVTIIECVCADGSSLQPGFVFSGKEFQSDWFDVHPDIVISMLPNGWTDEFICTEWFRQSFIPQTKAHTESSAPILLLVDGHGSHVTAEMRRLAMDNNIHLFCLPPHTTHRLQPLDVGVFGPLQTEWQNRCNEVLAETGSEVARGDLVREYCQVREKKFTAETILKAWHSSGLNPIDPDIFTDFHFAPSMSSSTLGHLPASFPTYDPFFVQNADDSDPENDERDGAGTTPSAEPDDGHMVMNMSDEDGNARDESSDSDSDDEADEVEQGQDEDNREDCPDENGEPKPDEVPGMVPAEEVREVNDADMTATDAASNGTPVVEDNTTEAVCQKSVSDEDTTEGTHLSKSRSNSPHLNRTQSHMARPRAGRTRPKTMLQELAEERQKNRKLEAEKAMVYSRLERAEAHCKLAKWEIGCVKKQLNQKKKPKKKNLIWDARCLTSGVGAAACNTLEEARRAKEAEKEEGHARKAQEEATRKEHREQRVGDSSFAFTGSLSSKSKPLLEDTASDLRLNATGTKDAIRTAIKSHLLAHPELKDNPRYKAIYPGTRARKRTLPLDLHDENQPPAAQRLRTDITHPAHDILPVPDKEAAGPSHSPANATFATSSFPASANMAVARPASFIAPPDSLPHDLEFTFTNTDSNID
ncbi:hypothetical protein EWM64_g10473, partial [Hericium alpestre]